MKVGTKSILFGAHQFILHPLLVLVAWIKLYGLPGWKELICIVIHDWGYWGCPNMDGPEGEQHPVDPAIWANFHLDPLGYNYYQNLILYHSRFLAKQNDQPVSKLCLADKWGTAMYPTWLWVLLCTLSGEVKEYMGQKNRYEILQSGTAHSNPYQFFKAYKSIAAKWVANRDTSIGRYEA